MLVNFESPKFTQLQCKILLFYIRILRQLQGASQKFTRPSHVSRGPFPTFSSSRNRQPLEVTIDSCRCTVHNNYCPACRCFSLGTSSPGDQASSSPRSIPHIPLNVSSPCHARSSLTTRLTARAQYSSLLLRVAGSRLSETALSEVPSAESENGILPHQTYRLTTFPNMPLESYLTLA